MVYKIVFTPIKNKMSDEYEVQRDSISLSARLINDNERTVEVTLKTPKGKQVSRYRKGVETSTEAELEDGEPEEDRFGDTYLLNYEEVYGELGPELREQIPGDWNSVLGGWLT